MVSIWLVLGNDTVWKVLGPLVWNFLEVYEEIVWKCTGVISVDIRIASMTMLGVPYPNALLLIVWKISTLSTGYQ